MSTSARIALLHVGGTIAMAPGPDGLEPRDGIVATYLGQLADLCGTELPRVDLHPLPPLLDSANMTPADWLRIARAIIARDADYDGFVVVHGTDTMAYSASAVSFLLEGLKKPVIFTGAQLPLTDPRSDGREHLITSLLIAGTIDVPEVCIYFGDRLLRGNRAQKISASAFFAFDSGNLPPLANVGIDVELRRHLVRPAGTGPLRLRKFHHSPEVIAVRVFPGMTPRMLEQLFAAPVEGVVLETYGAGTFPSANLELLAVIESAVRRGVVVVNSSSVLYGRARPGTYGTDAALDRVGVISGADMTPEAALTKLYCLLGGGLPPDEVRHYMAVDLAGELTVR